MILSRYCDSSMMSSRSMGVMKSVATVLKMAWLTSSPSCSSSCARSMIPRRSSASVKFSIASISSSASITAIADCFSKASK